MCQKAPGKAFRNGISLVELMDMFPDEPTARRWFEAQVWPKGRHCPKCGSTETAEVKNEKPAPYWCGACRSYFSVRTGTAIEKSKVPLRKWAIAIYLCATSLKSVSSMKLHRDLKVTQKTAWFMLHRLREAWAAEIVSFEGEVEIDETYMGGKRKNMPLSKRKALTGRGGVGKAIVAGAKNRGTNRVSAAVIANADSATLQGFVRSRVERDSTLYTDESAAYKGLRDYRHESVNHSVGEYVREQAHTNGIESFWAMLKRAHDGTFHKISPKHLQRYVNEFAGKHNFRESDTLDQMQEIVARLVGRRLLYKELTAQ